MWLNPGMVWLLVTALRAMAWTWRVNAEGLPTGPAVLAIRHGDLVALLGTHLGADATVAVSRSPDAQRLAQALERLGMRSVRGSTSRGAIGLYRGLRRALDAGERVVVAVDGPRGPAGVVQPGAVRLARDVPLFCAQVRTGWAWTLGSWDGQRIPMPFSRVGVRFVPCAAETEAVAGLLASPA